MRLPFVSRARLEALEQQVRDWSAVAATAENNADSWHTLYVNEVKKRDALMERVLAMKQQGFTTATERQMPTPPPPSRIDDAIAEKAGANGALRRHLSRWAAAEAIRGKSDEIIEQAIRKWTDPDEVEA